MAAQTPVYIYNQRQQVVLLQAGANATRRYEKVYSKELVVSKGVDNLLEFAFVNQDQKPVNITLPPGKDITCRIISYDGKKTLIQKSLTPLLPVTGISTLRLSADDIENINTQYCYYSLEIPVGVFNYPVFVDSQGGARGTIRIVNSVLPRFVPADEVTIPSHPFPTLNQPKSYASSEIFTEESPVLTVQTYYEKFTGNVQFQGSTLQDFSILYNIGNIENYNDYTGVVGTTINGYHPFVRLYIENAGTPPADPNNQNILQGDVVKMLSR